METPWEIAVIIPARDEEALLPRCLSSAIVAVDLLPKTVASQIVLISDSSSDSTPQLANDLLGNYGHVMNTNVGMVGQARALAASYAIHRARNPLHRLWLANTDADCIIPPRWLADQLMLADEGVEAVAGIVTVDSFEEHGPEVQGRFQASYFIDNDGTHPHVHGANMGIRADCYLRAGGWASLETAEDHDLWGRLRAIGAGTRSTAKIHVATSGRRVGRAPHGFAGALTAHNNLALTA